MTEHLHHEPQFNLEIVLDPVTEYVPLDWKSGVELIPGTIVRTKHYTHPNNYIFTCMDVVSDGSRSVGYLYRYELIDHRRELHEVVVAKINVMNIVPTLAEMNTPFLEFETKVGDRTTKIRPVYNSAEAGFSSKLAEHALQKKLERERRQTVFSGERAQAAITATARYLVENATDDEKDTLEYAASYILKHLIE
jgi:hypothetical protein